MKTSLAIIVLALATGCAALGPKPSPAKDAMVQLREMDATAYAAEKSWATSWKLRMADAISRGDVGDQNALKIEQKAADATVRSYQSQHLANEALLSSTLNSANGQSYTIPSALVNAHFSLTNTLYALPR